MNSQSKRVNEITLISFGELGEYKFIFTKDTFREYQRALDVADSFSTDIKKHDWNQILLTLELINLDSIEFLQPPTNYREIDGEWYRLIRINKDEEFIETPYYDSSFPNSKLILLDSILQMKAMKYSKIKWDKLFLIGKIQEKQNQQEPVYQIVDNMPQFNGGIGALSSFIRMELEKLELKHGKAFIEFIVTENGELIDIKLLKADNDLFGDYALQIVKIMPNWVPGVQNGNPVNVRVILPIEK